MRKIIMLVFVQLGMLGLLRAQDQVGCNQLLEDAREAYAAGMVELVPELLNNCIESGGLSGEARQDAYVLVISAYLFDYLPDEADAMMQRFLAEFPDYSGKPGDPSEFTLLLESHREKLPREQAPEETVGENQQEEPGEEEQQAEERPLPPPPAREKASKERSAGPGLGFILGTSLSSPQLIEPYAIVDPLEADGEYSMGGPGLQFGASFVLPLSRAIDLGIDVMYQQMRYAYTASPFDFTSYEYREKQNRFALPVSLLFNLNPEGSNLFYLRMGLVPDYMLSASAGADRTFSGEGAGLPGVSVEDVDVSPMRTSLNVSALGGAGMKFTTGSGFIFLEVRYQYCFMMANLPDERYSNDELLWEIYHVDNDFKLNGLGISAGMVFNLTK